MRLHVAIIYLLLLWNNKLIAVVVVTVYELSKGHLECEHKLHLDLFNEKEFKTIVFISLF